MQKPSQQSSEQSEVVGGREGAICEVYVFEKGTVSCGQRCDALYCHYRPVSKVTLWENLKIISKHHFIA